jgi:hypothetical protein
MINETLKKKPDDPYSLMTALLALVIILNLINIIYLEMWRNSSHKFNNP